MRGKFFLLFCFAFGQQRKLHTEARNGLVFNEGNSRHGEASLSPCAAMGRWWLVLILTEVGLHDCCELTRTYLELASEPSPDFSLWQFQHLRPKLSCKKQFWSDLIYEQINIGDWCRCFFFQGGNRLPIELAVDFVGFSSHFLPNDWWDWGLLVSCNLLICVDL